MIHQDIVRTLYGWFLNHQFKIYVYKEKENNRVLISYFPRTIHNTQYLEKDDFNSTGWPEHNEVFLKYAVNKTDAPRQMEFCFEYGGWHEKR